jgi:competence protein ComEC
LVAKQQRVCQSGGYFSIQHDLPIQQLTSSERPEMPAQISFDYCYQGQRWQWNEQVSIEVLSPAKPQLGMAGRSKNENSVGHYTNWGDDFPTPRILLIGTNLTF